MGILSQGTGVSADQPATRNTATGAPTSRIIATIILVLCAVIIVAREPMFLIQPRLWAEEGRVFLKFAYLHNPLTGLLYVPVKITSYFLLCATLPTTVASLVPLEEAATVTTYFCFAFTLSIFAVILYGRSYVWDTTWRKIVAVLVLLCASVLAREAWLNTVNLQLFCGIFTICLLAEDLRHTGRARRFFFRSLLLFCGLSGPYAVALVPAFLLKASREKSRESWVLGSILAICCAVQASLFLLLKTTGTVTSLKMMSLPIQHRAFLAFFHHVLRPFLGADNASAVLEVLHISATSVTKEASDFVILAGWASVAFYSAFVYWMIRVRRHPIQAPLILAFLSITGLSTLGATFGVPGERYAVVPFFSLAVLLLSGIPRVASVSRPVWRSLMALAPGVMFLPALVVGVHNYLNIADSAAYTPAAPLWRQEVQKWRSQPHHRMSIFPHPQWTFYLPDRRRLIEVNQSLSAALQGKSLRSRVPLEITDPTLRDISWEVIVDLKLELSIPDDDLRAELYLVGPGGRFNFRRVVGEKDASSKVYQFTFSNAVDPGSDSPELLEGFRRVDTLGIRLLNLEGEAVQVTRIAVSSFHRRALLYL